MKVQIQPNTILREAIRLFNLEWPDYTYRRQADGLPPPLEIPPLYPNGITRLWISILIEKDRLNLSLDEISLSYLKPAAINLAHRIPANSKFHPLSKNPYEQYGVTFMALEIEEKYFDAIECRFIVEVSPK